MVFVPEEGWKINLRLSLIKDRKASKFRNGFWCLFCFAFGGSCQRQIPPGWERTWQEAKKGGLS